MPMHIDFIGLKLMVNIANTSSMTRGAELSCISLSAASTRIKNLEDCIGTKLLYRLGQGVTLTPSGETLVSQARIVLNQIECLRSAMQEHVDGIKGHVRVFANTTSLSEYLPRVLQRYLIRNPDVNIDLQEHLSVDIVSAVVHGRADIGIIAGAIPTENLEVLPYRQDRLIVVVPQDHQLSRRSELEFVETLTFAHVGLQESSAIHAFLQRECNRVGKRVMQRIQVGNFETACRMIESGVGIGIIPESAAIRHSEVMDITLIPLKDPWSVRRMEICMQSFDMLPAFSRRLVQLLLEDAHENLAQAEGQFMKERDPLIPIGPYSTN